jgi:hypothetical protein
LEFGAHSVLGPPPGGTAILAESVFNTVRKSSHYCESKKIAWNSIELARLNYQQSIKANIKYHGGHMTRISTFDSTQPYKNQQGSWIRDNRSVQEEIRQRAYQLYEERGRRDGHDEDDWLQAEKELRREYGFLKAA